MDIPVTTTKSNNLLDGPDGQTFPDSYHWNSVPGLENGILVR